MGLIRGECLAVADARHQRVFEGNFLFCGLSALLSYSVRHVAGEAPEVWIHWVERLFHCLVYELGSLDAPSEGRNELRQLVANAVLGRAYPLADLGVRVPPMLG